MEMKNVIEYYGDNKKSVYSVENDNRGSKIKKMYHQFSFTHENSLKKAFREIFLPQGYPSSVSEDYLEYQMWDTMQAFCSSITGALATEAVMKGVGVGDEAATALAATTTWLLKDGAGMIGRIGFAWLKGTELDSYSKQWRLMADIMNDLAIFIDFLAPHFKPIFTLVVCFSSCCRALVGVAGGATRAALTQHQSRRNNLADVSAKDGSQETLVNLSALVISLILLPAVSKSGISWLPWLLWLMFTFGHLYANYKAVTCLKMDCFNPYRLRFIVRRYISNFGEVASVKEANKAEPVLPRLWPFATFLEKFGFFDPQVKPSSIEYGASIDLAPVEELNQLITDYDNYYFIYSPVGSSSVKVCFKHGSSHRHILQAALEAEILIQEYENKGYLSKDVHKRCRKYVESEFENFLSKVEHAGWRIDQSSLNVGEYRYYVE